MVFPLQSEQGIQRNVQRRYYMKDRRWMQGICAVLVCSLLAVGLFPLKAEAAPRKTAKQDLTYVKMVFDADYYYEQYPDVAAAFGKNPVSLLNHYVTYGIKEGRNASATFNATTYKNNYQDLKRAFGGNMFSYCQHYIEYGMAEGRNAMDVLVEVPTAESGTVIATYSTEYDVTIARATNVQLAASQIDGRVLQPQETFSFLGSITPRTIANGYVVAPIFSGGKVSKGVGGGICQVSSTIYAAVLGTSCEVVERHSHSLPVTYVPKGMDATVSSPSLDFRFTNSYEQPLLISVTTDGTGILTVTLSLQ